MSIHINGVGLIILLIVMAIFFYEWFRRFIALMLLPDNCFPGRHDKLVWGIAFVFLFFIAPITFYYWQKAYLEVREMEIQGADPQSV